MTAPLDFDDLRTANRLRTNGSFHSIEAWSPTDWMTAVAGEVGEAANLIKKLRRGDFTLDQRNETGIGLGRPMRELIGEELADVVTYLDLLAQRLDIDLGEAVRAKFNVVSDRVQSPIRL